MARNHTKGRTKEFDFAEDDPSERESGVRRVAPSVDVELVKAPASRHSQRPTVPVPAAVSIAYAESPAVIRQAALIVGPAPQPTLKLPAITQRHLHLIERSGAEGTRKNTLRVRLTPYARQHARADGETDDTPGSLLDHCGRIGSLDRMPHVCWTETRIRCAELDHRDGFVLSLIDGKTDVDTILDFCPMPMHQTLRILSRLFERGIIAFG